jgi:[ribosomal protein S18]-alanine N-acetyltransferase
MNARVKPILASLELKPLEPYQLDKLMEIETLAYDFPWTLGNFRDSLDAGHTVQSAWHGMRLVGYFVCMPVIDEVHLLNLTVAPSMQGQGIGRWLLEQVHAHVQAQGAQAVWLEVRPSNAAGLALYDSYGFKQVGIRKHYYPAALGRREDAILMKLLIGSDGAVV